jgi:hypothetical protein
MNLSIPNEAAQERYVAARAALLTYLMHKIDICDWHGVSDAANDLRVLEAEYAGHSSQIRP